MKYPQPTWTWWRSAELSRSVCASLPTGRSSRPSPPVGCPQQAPSLPTWQQHRCLDRWRWPDGRGSRDGADADAGDASSYTEAAGGYCCHSGSQPDSESGRRWHWVWQEGRRRRHQEIPTLSSLAGLRQKQDGEKMRETNSNVVNRSVWWLTCNKGISCQYIAKQRHFLGNPLHLHIWASSRCSAHV